MSLYSWTLPSPAPDPGGTPSSGGHTAPDSGLGALAGALDLYIDPATGDFAQVNAGPDKGTWREVSDSSTAVIEQIEIARNSWWGDPQIGSDVRALMVANARDEEIGGAIDAALRVMSRDEVIADVRVGDVERDGETLQVLITYTDRATGNPVDLVYRPLGG